MSKIRIAVVGAGLIGRMHIDALQQSTTCTLAAARTGRVVDLPPP